MSLESGRLQHRIATIFAIREFGNNEKERVLYVTVAAFFTVPHPIYIRELRMSLSVFLEEKSIFTSRIWSLQEYSFASLSTGRISMWPTSGLETQIEAVASETQTIGDLLMLRLSSGSVMSRFGGYRDGARGLLRHADTALSRDPEWRKFKFVSSAEAGISAFTFGVLQGKFKASGGLTAFGLPVDLLSGLGLHIFGLFNFAQPYAHHLHAVGDGALASFFTTTGYRVGERWASSGSLTKGMAGMLGDAKAPAGGSTIADKELASLVRAE